MHGNRKCYAEPGQRFGRLTVIRETRIPYAGASRVWCAVCSCDCGGETTAPLSGLIRGTPRSCGCLHKVRAMRDKLLEFLRARLDEDEAAANEIHRPRGCGSVDREGDFSPDPIWCSCDYPARVLREVTAKRCVIAAELDRFTDSLLPGEFAVLFALASVWSDHPDYQQEWARE